MTKDMRNVTSEDDRGKQQIQFIIWVKSTASPRSRSTPDVTAPSVTGRHDYVDCLHHVTAPADGAGASNAADWTLFSGSPQSSDLQQLSLQGKKTTDGGEEEPRWHDTQNSLSGGRGNCDGCDGGPRGLNAVPPLLIHTQ